MAKVKYHQCRKDGFVVQFNPQLEDNADFVVIEVEEGVDPNPSNFQAPVTDEDAEAQEAKALAAARALVAKADAKAKVAPKA